MLENYLPYLFITIGCILIIVSLFYKSEKVKLKQEGIKVEGIIFEQEISNNYNDNLFNSFNKKERDKVTVRFVTKKEEWITGVIQQDFQFLYTGQYKNGETVQVYYDEKKPSNFYVDTKQSEFIGRIFIAMGGIMLSIYGIYTLVK